MNTGKTRNNLGVGFEREATRAGQASMGKFVRTWRGATEQANDNAQGPASMSSMPRNRAAFTAALLNCQSRLRQLAHRLTSNSADADDLVQDTMVQALEHAAQVPFDSVARLQGWSITVLRNLSCDRYRKRRRELLTDQLDTIAMEPKCESETESAPAWRLTDDSAVETELQRLRSCLRETYVLFVQGLSYVEIASRLGIAVGTVGGRIHRARARLRKELMARSATGAAGGPSGESETPALSAAPQLIGGAPLFERRAGAGSARRSPIRGASRTVRRARG